MNTQILFKLATRGNPDGFIRLIYGITEKLADKENYKILVSADRDDESMYNAKVLNTVKRFIDSGKVVMCYDYSKSKIDAINRDMELMTNWDILVNLSDNMPVPEFRFDEKIKEKYLSEYPNLNGKITYDIDNSYAIVIGKKLYDSQECILKAIDENKINHNLIVNYYTDKNNERTNELNYCIIKNIYNENLDKIVVICTESDYSALLSIYNEYKDKLIPIITNKRPSYNDYFAITKKLFNGNNNINIISNLDIIISPEMLLQQPNCDIHKVASDYLVNNNCLALTRWDVKNTSDFRDGSVLFDRPDSQDTWIFKGAIPQISGADFTLGVAGCDNKIAYLLEQSGYNVINPSRTIKTYHLHLTDIRNYTDIVGHAIERLEPPYKLLHPTE
ncbi:MAG: hypothetical protein IPJ01_11670 [Micavibrio sp.]|nr:hypothetical protein [Micavibrio sp.]